MSRPDSLLVTGGQVLAGGKWTAADVFLANGRIVSVGSDVRTSGTGGGPGEPTEVGTAGAGAERAALRPFASNETATAAGSESPAAGGVSARRLDASGLLVVPGFLDLQCNGAVGVDITAEPERLWDVAAALPQWGVTAWLPTVVTAPAATRVRALAALRSGRAGDPAGPAGARPVAVPLGLHLEGPFLAPERRGGDPPQPPRAPGARRGGGRGGGLGRALVGVGRAGDRGDRRRRDGGDAPVQRDGPAAPPRSRAGRGGADRRTGPGGRHRRRRPPAPHRGGARGPGPRRAAVPGHRRRRGAGDAGGAGAAPSRRWCPPSPTRCSVWPPAARRSPSTATWPAAMAPAS